MSLILAILYLSICAAEQDVACQLKLALTYTTDLLNKVCVARGCCQHRPESVSHTSPRPRLICCMCGSDAAALLTAATAAAAATAGDATSRSPCRRLMHISLYACAASQVGTSRSMQCLTCADRLYFDQHGSPSINLTISVGKVCEFNIAMHCRA